MEVPVTVRKGFKYLSSLFLAATLILILLAVFSFSLSPDISFHLTIFTLNSFFTSLITLFFGLFVYFENPKRIENQTWLLFSATITIWSFGFGQMVSSETHDAARFWAKINHIGTIFIPATSFHFVLAFLGRLTSQNKKILTSGYTLSGIFEFLNLSNLLYEVQPSVFFRFYAGGRLYPLFVLMFVFFVSMCIYELLRGYRNTSGIKQNQILYILLAFIVSYGGWVINFLPALDLQIFPFGHYLVPLYMAFVGYAIIKYRLMDISVVINKGAAYIALVGMIFIPAYLSFLFTHRPTIYSIPPLISATIILSCGLWILLNNPSTVTNRTLCLVCVATSIWLFGDFLGHYYETTYLWGRLANVGVVYLPAFFYHFVVSFLKDDDRRLVIANYLFSTIFLCLIPTSLFFNGEYTYYWGRYIKAGVLHPVFLAYFFTLSWVALKKLYGGYKARLKKDSLEATRIKYVLLAFVIAYPASIDYFPNYGWDFYPIGFLFITFWALIVSYAIVKYQLMEIRFTAARLWTFTRLLILIPLYLGILLLERYFYGSTNYLFAGELLAIFILGAGVIYNAKQQVEEVIAQTFFKKDYQSSVALRSFSNEMMTILDQEELTCKIVENLSTAMELEQISLFVQNEKGDYVLAAACPAPSDLIQDPKQGNKIIRAENDRAFFSWLEQQERVIELEEIEYESQYEIIRPMARRYFSDVQAKVCLPLVHHRKLIGIINLGGKTNQKPFTHLDIEFLASFRGQAISALYNALVHHGIQQISQELEHMVELRTHELQERTRECLLAKSRLMEMELIATSSGTLVHAIKNPLLIIQTYVKLASSAIDTMNYPKAKEELDQIYRSSITIFRILQGLRRAHIDPPQKVRLHLPDVLEACERDVLGDRYPSQYQTIKRYDVDIPIEGDPNQLRMAFANLFINALEAMPDGGQIVFRTYESGGGVFVSINDSGSGIQDKMLPNLFRPFFTTKESGTGLGLWTAKRIIEINHGGKLKVESDAGGGTSAIAWLPIAHPKRDSEYKENQHG
ncbi:MAG: histidine kinase N-terminal 7TM domain-containing protein [Candidatus Manganitrophaceae bacterium]